MDKDIEQCIDETEKHQKMVAFYIEKITKELETRACTHDMTKLVSPELEGFAKHTSNLKGLTYGSDEYKAELKAMQSTIAHHYENNKHHPEHYKNGYKDMDLVDIVEMFADWCAACRRHNNGNLYESLEISKSRFDMSDDIIQIFKNTVKNFNI